jgi:TonB family protein
MRAGLILSSVIACFALASAFAARGVIAPPPNVIGLLTHAPQPEYPADALQRHASGAGVFLLRTQIQTGHVSGVVIGRSTGDTSLDSAAVKVLLQWRFKPGALTHRKITSVRLNPPLTEAEALIKVPVTFVL